MRRPLSRLLIALPLCTMLVFGSLAAGWLFLEHESARGATWFQVTAFGDAQYSGAPSKPFFMLVLGNDGRSDADTGLGDAVHVIGVNPETKQATIINVPRDTQAPAGDKINAYYTLQGLPGMVDQLNQMMGINISYAITTNFPHFVAMVDQMGGIEINIPKDLNDPDSGANFSAGPARITGDQALAISRDRKDYPIEGDVARTANQALIILSALKTLRAQNPGDARTMELVAMLVRHVKMQNLDLTALFRLGRLALSIDVLNVKSITIPVSGGSGTNLVVGAGGAELFANFRDDGVVQ